jgi:hypothetical protein
MTGIAANVADAPTWGAEVGACGGGMLPPLSPRSV